MGGLETHPAEGLKRGGRERKAKTVRTEKLLFSTCEKRSGVKQKKQQGVREVEKADLGEETYNWEIGPVGAGLQPARLGTRISKG